MPITDFLERNAELYGDEVSLVELNPEIQEKRYVTWKEFALTEPMQASAYRREITWSVFNEKANRFANLLISRGIGKNDKVAILLMNCLEWLPIYFGVLKTGAIAVPFNFRYDTDEIEYCAELAEVNIMVFGNAFMHSDGIGGACGHAAQSLGHCVKPWHDPAGDGMVYSQPQILAVRRRHKAF